MKSVVVILALILLSGCVNTSPKHWKPANENESGEFVTVQYRYHTIEHMFSVPEGSPTQDKELATAKCQARGYDTAIAFSGTNPNCASRQPWSTCSIREATKIYHCVNYGNK